MSELKTVSLYTDGACLGNPGPGGYGVILISEGRQKELSAGYRLTTNNRMEILAAVAGLEALRLPCKVTIYTDSQYVANAISLGWAKKWRDNGWMRTKKEKASNSDLWMRILDLCETHEIAVQWIKGHAGHPENERCDQLSVIAASGNNLLEDTGYLVTLSEIEKQAAERTARSAMWPDNHAISIRSDNTFMFVRFRDERELRFPLAWFSSLLSATPEQRSCYELLEDGLLARFPDLELELRIEHVLGHGNP